MRYDSLNAEVESLRGKILAVQQITSSKTDRYRSVILIDILDNLRPKGIWFTNLSDDTGSQTIYLSGGGFDPLLIAKFMTNLIALKRQKVSITDLRSNFYFSKIVLEKVSSGGAKAKADKVDSDQDISLEKGGESTSQGGFSKEDSLIYEFILVNNNMNSYEKNKASGDSNGNLDFYC